MPKPERVLGLEMDADRGAEEGLPTSGLGLAVGVLVDGGVELEAETERGRLAVGDCRGVHEHRPEHGGHSGHYIPCGVDSMHRVAPGPGPAAVRVAVSVHASELDISRRNAMVNVGMRMRVHVLVSLSLSQVRVGVEFLDRQVGRPGLVGTTLATGRELAVKLALEAAVARVTSEALQVLIIY
jgi:hypothetical protein